VKVRSNGIKAAQVDQSHSSQLNGSSSVSGKAPRQSCLAGVHDYGVVLLMSLVPGYSGYAG